MNKSIIKHCILILEVHNKTSVISSENSWRIFLDVLHAEGLLEVVRSTEHVLTIKHLGTLTSDKNSKRDP